MIASAAAATAEVTAAAATAPAAARRPAALTARAALAERSAFSIVMTAAVARASAARAAETLRTSPSAVAVAVAVAAAVRAMFAGFATAGAASAAIGAAAAPSVDAGARAAGRNDDAIRNFVTALADVRGAPSTACGTNIRRAGKVAGAQVGRAAITTAVIAAGAKNGTSALPADVDPQRLARRDDDLRLYQTAGAAHRIGTRPFAAGAARRHRDARDAGRYRKALLAARVGKTLRVFFPVRRCLRIDVAVRSGRKLRSAAVDKQREGDGRGKRADKASIHDSASEQAGSENSTFDGPLCFPGDLPQAWPGASWEPLYAEGLKRCFNLRHRPRLQPLP